MNSFPFPNLPTDNLYKFYALSGIVIAVFSIFTLVYTVNIVDKNTYELKGKVGLNKLEIDFLKEDNESYVRLASSLKKEELLTLNSQITNNEKEIRRKSLLINLQRDQLSKEIDKLNRLFYLCVFLVIIGISLSWVGFWLWKKKVQNPIDKKLEIELKQINKSLNNKKKKN